MCVCVCVCVRARAHGVVAYDIYVSMYVLSMYVSVVGFVL